MVDNHATATVPIDERIQHFAIDVDRAGGTSLLPLFRDLVQIEAALREVGADGIAFSDIHEQTEHTSISK